MAEFGGNFSVGEAQLVRPGTSGASRECAPVQICVARAILKTSPILFIDEATASVDPARRFALAGRAKPHNDDEDARRLRMS